jgi:hypothetical protein
MDNINIIELEIRAYKSSSNLKNDSYSNIIY